MATKKTQKNSPDYFCEICDFISFNKNDLNRHLTTQKHIRNKSATLSNNLSTEKTLHCNWCNKMYKDRSGLWRHSKRCKNNSLCENIQTENDDITNKELMVMIINDNKELRNLLIEQVKEKDELKNMVIDVIKNANNNSIINNNCNINSNNKTFNLQFFLNETCKDAMNIMDFIDSIKLQLSDLEKIGEIGYVEGISNIITSNLKALDVSLRPVHCTDKKRETIYIKDEDKWEKEDNNKTKLRKAIKKIANKNIKLLPQFREKYPDYGNAYSKVSDKYNKMVIEAMVSDIEKENKIIHNISKCSIIDKYEN